MTKVIEIVVIGGTGSGKSHVLELIDKALRAEYGHRVQIASHDLSCERGLGSPGTKPRVSETIFSLKERQTDAQQVVGGMKIEIDTSDIDAALGKLDLLCGSVGYAEPGNAMSGCAIDPLEQAIDQAVRLVAEAEGELAVKLSCHLDALLAKQLDAV